LRLYTRILLSFWAVTVLFVAGVVGVVWFVMLEHADELARVPDRLTREAALALERDGVAGLTAWLKSPAAHGNDFEVYVVDAGDQDLLGRRLPLRAQHRLHMPPGEPPPPGVHMLPARPTPVLIGRDGGEYRVLVLSEHGVLAPFSVPGARIALLVLALSVTGLASLALTRSIAGPVQSLGEATRALAAGNLAARVAPHVSTRRDELGKLARDFDLMADQLRALIEGKERLLRDISHELRSPLARLRVALGLARQSGGDVGRQLERIETEAERLDALIGQILRLSRLAQPSASVLADEVDLGDLVDGITRDAAFEAQARGVRVDFSAPIGAVLVRGNATLLASAVENVIRNAVAYSPPGGVVTATVENPAAIVVTDQGPGVPTAELERIFEPFHRVAEARTRDSGGDGIGLAITRRVLAAHGGSASAANRPGGGLVVRLELAAGA
jgi:two-component system, OmpR family, sensor kinase